MNTLNTITLNVGDSNALKAGYENSKSIFASMGIASFGDLERAFTGTLDNFPWPVVTSSGGQSFERKAILLSTTRLCPVFDKLTGGHAVQVDASGYVKRAAPRCVRLCAAKTTVPIPTNIDQTWNNVYDVTLLSHHLVDGHFVFLYYAFDLDKERLARDSINDAMKSLFGLETDKLQQIYTCRDGVVDKVSYVECARHVQGPVVIRDPSTCNVYVLTDPLPGLENAPFITSTVRETFIKTLSGSACTAAFDSIVPFHTPVAIGPHSHDILTTVADARAELCQRAPFSAFDKFADRSVSDSDWVARFATSRNIQITMLRSKFAMRPQAHGFMEADLSLEKLLLFKELREVEFLTIMRDSTSHLAECFVTISRNHPGAKWSDYVCSETPDAINFRKKYLDKVN